MSLDKEQRIIQLVAEGLKNREIGDILGTSEHVVKNYLRVIYDKLGLWNRVELALWYVKHEEDKLRQSESHSQGATNSSPQPSNDRPTESLNG